MWLGRLDKEAESEVLRMIADPAGSLRVARRLRSGQRVLSIGRVKAIMASARAGVILDIGERRSFKPSKNGVRSVNIPFEELSERAPLELKATELQILDCTDSPDLLCSIALDILKREGFEVLPMDSTLAAGEKGG